MGRAGRHPVQVILGGALGRDIEDVPWERLLNAFPLVPGVRLKGSHRRGKKSQKALNFVEELGQADKGLWLLVREWAEGPDFLTAPERWPTEGIRLAFTRELTPFEFSYGWQGRTEKLSENQRMLVAYVHGIKLPTLALLMGWPEGMVLQKMEEGAKEFLSYPWFTVWHWGVNWSRTRIPAEWAQSYSEKMKLWAVLREDETRAPDGFLRRLTTSPKLTAYAVHVAPKIMGMRRRPKSLGDAQYVRPPIMRGMR